MINKIKKFLKRAYVVFKKQKLIYRDFKLFWIFDYKKDERKNK